MPHDPAELRGKMIVLDRSTAKIEHTVFLSIGDYFRSGDLLVLNDSYVLSNTLVSQHGDKSAQVALYGHEPDGTTVVEIKSEQQSSVKPGLILRSTNDDRLNCILLEPQPDRLWKVTFEPIELLMPTLGRYGTTPLNPTYWKTAPHACLRYLPVRILCAAMPRSLRNEFDMFGDSMLIV